MDDVTRGQPTQGMLTEHDLATLVDTAPDCVPGQSAINGWGLFARVAIAPGAVVIDFSDPALYREVAIDDLDEADVRGGKFTAISRHIVLTTDRFTKYALLNHSRTPNAITDMAARVVRAARDITPGEEVTVDYRLEPMPERARPFIEPWL